MTAGGLRHTFYQLAPPQMVREAAASTEEIIRLMPRLRAELDRLDLKRVRLVAGSDTFRPWWRMSARAGCIAPSLKRLGHGSRVAPR